VAIATGLLSIKDFAPAMLRYWIGEHVRYRLRLRL
jgi:hypothetical protein